MTEISFASEVIHVSDNHWLDFDNIKKVCLSVSQHSDGDVIEIIIPWKEGLAQAKEFEAKNHKNFNPDYSYGNWFKIPPEEYKEENIAEIKEALFANMKWVVPAEYRGSVGTVFYPPGTLTDKWGSGAWLYKPRFGKLPKTAQLFPFSTKITDGLKEKFVNG